jgi:subtilisin family serine protease
MKQLPSGSFRSMPSMSQRSLLSIASESNLDRMSHRDRRVARRWLQRSRWFNPLLQQIDTVTFPTKILRGRLEATDQLNPTRRNRYMDNYLLVNQTPGQQIHVRLESQAIDTYLQVIDADTGKVVLKNDDIYLGWTLNSRLTFTVQDDRQYLLRVTSYGARERGAYKLETRSVRPAAIAGFDFNSGYGLIDAASAVARATGRDRPFRAVRDLSGKRFWGINRVNAPESWAQGHTGEGVVVAVLDTGVDFRHPDLRRNIWRNRDEIPNNGIDDDRNGYIDDVRGWNFAFNDNNTMDYEGHGTHVAGTIAAVRNQFGATGVAPDAEIMPVSVLGGWGLNYQQFDRSIARGIRYAVRNGADIITMSLGNYPGEPTLRRTRAALRFARRQNVVVTMASGNERQDFGAIRPIQPADFSKNDLGIAVGAIAHDNQMADFSTPAGRRQMDFFVAPGVNIFSTLPWGYGFYSGTSMATPHVAGVAALMLSANPSLTPAQVERILRQTSTSDGITAV